MVGNFRTVLGSGGGPSRSDLPPEKTDRGPETVGGRVGVVVGTGEVQQSTPATATVGVPRPPSVDTLLCRLPRVQVTPGAVHAVVPPLQVTPVLLSLTGVRWIEGRGKERKKDRREG